GSGFKSAASSSFTCEAASPGAARRRVMAVWRIASMRSNPSLPVCTRSTSPRTRPSKRVSSLSGRSLSVGASIKRSLASLRASRPMHYAYRARVSISTAALARFPNLTVPDPVQALLDHRRTLAGHSLTELFAADPQRASKLSLGWDEWLADWSKQRVTAETMSLLLEQAQARNLELWIA